MLCNLRADVCDMLVFEVSVFRRGSYPMTWPLADEYRGLQRQQDSVAAHLRRIDAHRKWREATFGIGAIAALAIGPLVILRGGHPDVLEWLVAAGWVLGASHLIDRSTRIETWLQGEPTEEARLRECLNVLAYRLTSLRRDETNWLVQARQGSTNQHDDVPSSRPGSRD